MDGDGESVRRGQLALGADEDSAHVQAILITDSTGHFEAAVRTTGEVAAHALSRGVGRSVSRALFLPEGRRTEAGDFVLAAPGDDLERDPDGGRGALLGGRFIFDERGRVVH